MNTSVAFLILNYIYKKINLFIDPKSPNLCICKLYPVT